MVDNDGRMRVSAKADYAARAAVELATAGDGPIKADRIAEAQEIPGKFLETILSSSSTPASCAASAARTVATRWRVRPTRSASPTSSAPWTGRSPTSAGTVRRTWSTQAPRSRLTDVWVAVRAALREILETTSLADLRDGDAAASASRR